MFWKVRRPRAPAPRAAQAEDLLAVQQDAAASAGTRPVMALNSVDLPEPFGPITATTPPEGTVISTLFSATRPPNFTVTSLTSSSVAGGRLPARHALEPDEAAAPHLGALLLEVQQPAACAGRRDQAVAAEQHHHDQDDAEDQLDRLHQVETAAASSMPRTRRSRGPGGQSSASNQDCSSCSMTAPSTTPQTLPMPPSTTITRTMAETGKPNISGVAVCNLAT